MAKKKDLKVPVSERALVQRINRALAAEDQQLLKTRGDRWRHDLGDFYVVTSSSSVLKKHVDIVELATELQVLKPFERLADGS